MSGPFNASSGDDAAPVIAVGPTTMYIRFVTSDIDCASGRRQGLFQAVACLKKSTSLNAYDRSHLEQIGAWFTENLKKPNRLSMSRRPHGKPQAISWFKDTAVVHIGKMREFQNVLETYGIRVEVIKSRRIGYVVYEDQFQIVACPFSDTQA